FRLEEPEELETPEPPRKRKTAAGDWYVRYLLQGAEDPSLLVPAAQAWTARGRKAAVLGGFDAREYLLAALGQAAGRCPLFEDSLRTAAPAGQDLDSRGAMAFLTERAGLLEQAGFGVLLPAWWSRKGTKMRLAARAHVKSPAMQGGSGLTLDEIVHFHWQVAL